MAYGLSFLSFSFLISFLFSLFCMYYAKRYDNCQYLCCWLRTGVSEDEKFFVTIIMRGLWGKKRMNMYRITNGSCFTRCLKLNNANHTWVIS